MAREKSFDMAKLKAAATLLKRDLKQSAKKMEPGQEFKLIKKQVADRLAERIGLKGHRSLYDGGEVKQFYDSWYEKLEEEIKVIVQKNNEQKDNKIVSITGASGRKRTGEATELRKKNKELNQVIKSQRERMRKLAKTNFELRARLLRSGKILEPLVIPMEDLINDVLLYAKEELNDENFAILQKELSGWRSLDSEEDLDFDELDDDDLPVTFNYDEDLDFSDID